VNSRWRWVAVVAILVVAAAGGTAYVVTRPDPTRHRQAVIERPVIRPAALSAVATAGAGPATLTGVAAALARAAADPAFGGSLTGMVVDAATGDVLLDRDGGTPMTPASTVKLLTAAVALTTLGPTATLRTEVLRSGSTLYLRGGGDVTLTAKPVAASAYPRPATVPALAAGTAKHLGGIAVTTLCADITAWSGPSSAPGWSPGYFSGGDIEVPTALEVDEGRLTQTSHARAAHPAHTALATFANALTKVGVRVRRADCVRPAPPGATVVASVASAPVATLVARMLTASDNDLAEALGRAAAASTGRPASFGGAAAALTEGLTQLGVTTDGLHLYDASGLSRLDRVSAATLVAALRLAARDPALRGLLDGVPIAGATGTLEKRYRSKTTRSGAGVVRAKTGTLAGVNSLAGSVVDTDGRLLVFAFFTDRAASPTRAEAALDRLAAILAGCGCR
jgi:D-alanyl-D-alanine carboxypeptidase/D-alanyl-D-alanine-endopeptidase (penicillin-binding protein 4)